MISVAEPSGMHFLNYATLSVLQSCSNSGKSRLSWGRQKIKVLLLRCRHLKGQSHENHHPFGSGKEKKKMGLIFLDKKIENERYYYQMDVVRLFYFKFFFCLFIA